MENHFKYMKYAIEQALIAKDEDEVPIGCVIVKDNIIIAKRHNTRHQSQDATAHAEMDAIKDACKYLNSWRLEDCDVYVTVEPCAMCAGAMIMARVKTIIYGASNQKFGAVDSNIQLYETISFNHTPKVIAGVMKEECSNIMKSYFKEKR